MLGHYMGSMGGLGIPLEWLLPLFDPPVKYGIAMDDVRSLLATGYDAGSESYGIKLMVNYCGPLADVIAPQLQLSDNLRIFDILKSEFENRFVVSLTRNGIEQTISRYLSQKSGLYHRYSDGGTVRSGDGVMSYEEACAAADFDDLIRLNGEIQQERLKQSEMVKALDCSTLEITYEQLVSEPVHSAQRIYDTACSARMRPTSKQFQKATDKVVDKKWVSYLRDGLIAHAHQTRAILFE
jgi:LPS sulfotransferase NodH